MVVNERQDRIPKAPAEPHAALRPGAEPDYIVIRRSPGWQAACPRDGCEPEKHSLGDVQPRGVTR